MYKTNLVKLLLNLLREIVSWFVYVIAIKLKSTVGDLRGCYLMTRLNRYDFVKNQLPLPVIQTNRMKVPLKVLI